MWRGLRSWSLAVLLLSASLFSSACGEDGVTGDDDTLAGDDDVQDDDVADDDTSVPDCVSVWVTWLQEVDASPDVGVDWSTLTETAAGEPFDPATDITQVAWAFFWLTAEEARQALCDDSLMQSDTAYYEADACPDDWDLPYLIDTSIYDGLSLIVSIMVDEAFGTAAVATVTEGSPNTIIHLENGGAVME